MKNCVTFFFALLIANLSIAQDDCSNIPDVNIQNNNSYLMAMGQGSRVEIHAADAAKQSFTKLSETANAGTNTITVTQNIGWEVGDVIAIAPTDFNWAERETRAITAISNNGTTITLNAPLNHRHNGTTEDYSSGSNNWTLDMRAEVALLSRNVTIQGNANSVNTQYGGHTMVMMGAKQHISGAEYFRMGQAGILGKYPLHWHLIRDGGQGQYIRNTSVHGGFNKGITIHDTNNTYLEDNVVYNNIGHGFFFEDATETGNVLRGNIAFGQRRAPNLAAATIPSDRTFVSSYWVTNPNNHFIDNVAAGSERKGFWMPAEPTATGQALASGDYDDYEPRAQPVGVIRGFTGHSNGNHNFAMGWRAREETNGAIQTGTFIQRHDENGALYDYLVEDMTLYKGGGDGQLWVRGFGGTFNNIILADAREQMMLRGNNALRNSLVLADTETNEPTSAIRDGLQLYDQGITFENLHFVDYNTENDHAFYQRRGVDVGVTHSVHNLTFENVGEAQKYSDRTANNTTIDGRNWNGNVLLDIDGSLFGVPMAVITPQLDNTSGNIAINSPRWNAHPDAILLHNEAWQNPPGTVIGKTVLFGANNQRMTRSDGPSITGANRMNETLVIADEGIEYTIEPGGNAYAADVSLAVEGINRGSEVLYRFLDMPANANVEGASEVSSRNAFNSAALSCFWRESNSVMMIKLVGVDPYQIPSQTPAEVTNRWANYVTIHTDGNGVQSADQNFTGEHNLGGVAPGAVQIPAFVSGQSDTRNITNDMARWSAANTWDNQIPNDNSLVLIGPGQTVVLDQSVTVHGIIVSGGELLIEDNENLTIELTTDFILVNNGGLFQAGRESNLLETDFTLTLAGTDPNFDLQINNNEIIAGQGNTVYVNLGQEDSDNDGICDFEDICPNLNNNLIGTSCDDGDSCTTDDVYDANCECQGTLIDNDNNGICDTNLCIEVEVYVYLEGAFDAVTNKMSSLLIARGLLPGQTPTSNLVTPTPSGQPYNTAPWNYAGTEGAGWTDEDYTGNETDWVLVSFRTGTAKNTEIVQTAALLNKDGSMTFPDRCALPSTVVSSLYVVVEHRNHIGIMTPQPIDIIGNTLTYDFRSSDSYRDPTSSGQQQLPTGEWSLYAGDSDQNDAPSFDINGLDKTLWFDNNGLFDNYIPSDFNLDGDVNGEDKIIWEINNGISSRVPK